MADSLQQRFYTPKEYLEGLRSDDIRESVLILRPEGTTPSDDEDRDITNFENFLRANGHPKPQPTDLFLTVTRKALLRILYYADDRTRHCLILQSCFGFDTTPTTEVANAGYVPPELPINQRTVGRVVVINKGNFQELQDRDDEDFFTGDTVYRNSNQRLELFLNLNLDHRLSSPEARQLTDNFAALYPDNPEEPFIQGFLLPVKALIKLFTDSDGPFGRAHAITLHWGLTSFDGGSRPGNFSLYIGIDDLRKGPAIVFRNPDVKGMLPGDCPPNTGCPRPPGRG